MGNRLATIDIGLARASYLEERFAGAGLERAVLDTSLLDEVVCGLDRRQHALDGEKRRQVGRVRRDKDQRKEPPRAAGDAARQRPACPPVSK